MQLMKITKRTDLYRMPSIGLKNYCCREYAVYIMQDQTFKICYTVHTFMYLHHYPVSTTVSFNKRNHYIESKLTNL